MFLYFYRNRDRFSDWQAVVIYPSRTTEQRQTHPYRALLECEQMNRVYLDELGEIDQLPLNLALIALTMIDEADAPEAARNLLARSQRENQPPPMNRAIMDMVTTIMVYKFTHLSQREVEEMLGVRLQETRVYQEVRAEGEEFGRRDEATSFVLRLLTRKLGEVSEAAQSQINDLSLPQLESLGEALLDFTSPDDLATWLAAQE
nr:DUF2887 domain-containing protein [Romeria gracilis]